MKKLTFLIMLISFCGYSQVGVGTTVPDATLDIVAANPTGTATTVDGILIPRVDRQRAQSMTGTITSTMIFVNSVATGTAAGTAVNITSTGFYYYDGAVWQKIATGANNNWDLAGNTGTTAGTNFIGTTDAVDFRIKTAGTDKWNISNANSGQLQSYSLGTITAPIYSFQGDTNTGIFSSAADNLGFVTNGSEKLRIPNADQIHAMSLGTAALPFYSFGTDPNTGIFSPAGGDILAVATNGSEKARVEADGDVGIGVTPDVSAKLDVSATNRGFLAPRVALTAVNAAGPIATPATGLFVYNTATSGVSPNNVVPGYYYNSGTTVAPIWKRFSTGGGDGWQTTGNAGTTAANYVGTSDAVDFKISTTGTERARVLSGGQVIVNNTGAPFAGDRFSVYNTASGEYAVNGYTTGTGAGVYGQNTGGSGFGLWGANNSTGYGVYGTNTLTGIAVRGNSTGTGAGVYGNTAAAVAAGVFGVANVAVGAGVYGTSNGNLGTGVDAYASGTNGTGVSGYADNTGGDGVIGEATQAARYGVWGINNNATGFGVRGTTTGTGAAYGVYGSSAGTYGVFGTSTGTAGFGVYGLQNQAGRPGVYGINDNGSGFGVYGTSAGATGTGISGVTTGTTGYGVVGTSVGTSGIGVYGSQTQPLRYGVYGVNNNNTGYGVVGTTSGTTAMAVNGSTTGIDATGVGGFSSGSNADGVYGQASGATGYGIWGVNNNNTGMSVVGTSTGTTAYGVNGTTSGSDATGVAGFASGSNADGVYGQASGATGYGVWGVNNNASGNAVVGTSTGTNSSGVSGVSTGSNGIGVSGSATSATNSGVKAVNLDTGGTGLIAAGNNTTPTYLVSGSAGAFNSTLFGTAAWATTVANGTGVAGAGNNEPITTLGTTGAGGAFTGNQWAVTGVATITGAGNDGTDRGVLLGSYVSNGSTVDNVYVGARVAGVNYKILGTGGGSVSTTMKTSQGERILFAPEATENWFFDMGEVTLVNGKATVSLDPIFVETLSDSKPFKVFVQGGENTLGSIRITRNQSGKSFIVEDLGGASDGIVQYSVYGIWKGKENLRLPELKEEDKPKQQIAAQNKSIDTAKNLSDKKTNTAGDKTKSIQPVQSVTADTEKRVVVENKTASTPATAEEATKFKSRVPRKEVDEKDEIAVKKID
jgi:hypothetical protein